jgi:hypothetical protein
MAGRQAMNYFKLIPALWKAKGIVQDEIKESEKMDTTDNKPGWKKTEFWAKIFMIDLPLLWTAVKGFVPPDKALYIELIGAAGFAVINTVQKTIENWKAIKQTTETTTITPAPATVSTTTPA